MAYLARTTKLQLGFSQRRTMSIADFLPNLYRGVSAFAGRAIPRDISVASPRDRWQFATRRPKWPKPGAALNGASFHDGLELGWHGDFENLKIV